MSRRTVKSDDDTDDASVCRDVDVLAFACSFAIGVALLENEQALPDPMWCASMPVAVWLAMAKVRAGPLLAVVAGYTWAAFLAHVQMGELLPAAVEGRDLVVTGIVRGLPQVRSAQNEVRFRRRGQRCMAR